MDCGFESHRPHQIKILRIRNCIMDNFEETNLDTTNIREEKVFEEYAEYIMNEVSDEKIEDLFFEMGIDIDLNKPWSD